MPKRQGHSKDKNANPLATARKRHKQNQKAESLWLQKSGASFQLFVEYYAHQPIGVCSGDGNERNPVGKLAATASATSNDNTNRNNNIAGQSRAAKRRQKKKKQQLTTESSTTTLNDPSKSSSTIESNRTRTEMTTNIPPPPLCNARLWGAFQEHGPSATHLVAWIAALVRPLPLTFRLRQSIDLRKQSLIQQEIHDQFGDWVACLDRDAAKDETSATNSSCLRSLVFQATTPSLHKGNLSKQTPALKDYLVRRSQDGTLARQELASMLPVLALQQGGYLPSRCRQGNDATRRYRVLDMCASPGSKTLQVLEALLLPDKDTNNQDHSHHPTHRLKANDIHPQRLETLKNAIDRSGVWKTDSSSLSPYCRKMLSFSNADARHIPVPMHKSKAYQVILCDVPCSGDGTVRKDPFVLPQWSPRTAHALHPIQLAILMRALASLAIGGVVSYSTCSHNPVENEAVVAAALQQANHKNNHKTNNNKNADDNAFELLPWPVIPGLGVRPGVTEWKVADFVGDADPEDEDRVRLRWYDTYHEYKQQQDGGGDSQQQAAAAVPQQQHPKLVSSLWPPVSQPEHPLPLGRCARLWPQDHDSGGFFVALIQRNR